MTFKPIWTVIGLGSAVDIYFSSLIQTLRASYTNSQRKQDSTTSETMS